MDWTETQAGIGQVTNFPSDHPHSTRFPGLICQLPHQKKSQIGPWLVFATLPLHLAQPITALSLVQQLEQLPLRSLPAAFLGRILPD